MQDDVESLYWRISRTHALFTASLQMGMKPGCRQELQACLCSGGSAVQPFKMLLNCDCTYNKYWKLFSPYFFPNKTPAILTCFIHTPLRLNCKHASSPLFNQLSPVSAFSLGKQETNPSSCAEPKSGLNLNVVEAPLTTPHWHTFHLNPQCIRVLFQE